jgi:hypothetical protein
MKTLTRSLRNDAQIGVMMLNNGGKDGNYYDCTKMAALLTATT